MNTATPGTGRKIFKKKKIIRIIASCLAVALLAGGAYVFVQARKSKATSAVAQRTATVIRGQLVDSIAGSAPIESSNRSELSPKVTATLEQINVKVGDQVKKGDVLFVLDSTDALLDIENTKNNIDQMQLTIDNTAKGVNGLVVKAPYSGQVKNLNIREGDNINKGGSLFTLIGVDDLDVTLAFSGTAINKAAIGQKVTVYIQDLMLSVDGEITYKSSKPYTTASGGELYNVEISISNPGSLKEGMKATAEITVGGVTLESVESGTLSYKNNQVMKSDAGGTIKTLNVRENEFVNAGDILAVLENDDLLLTTNSNDIKMNNFESQLEIQKKQLDYYTIVAPFDGTITKMGNANEGDTVKQGDTLAILSDMGHLQFSVSIDELDISDVEVGQTVSITADAIEETSETPLTGKVSEVAMEGTSSNGVTVYQVTVTVDDDSVSKLKTGMNIDAEILITNKSDVLMVPLEAVTKMGNRSFVYVVGEASQSEQSGQPGSSSGQSSTNRPQRPGNTTGSAMRGPGGMRSTSGAAIGGPGGPGNTSGSAIGGPGRPENTSGAAFDGSGMPGTPPQGDFSPDSMPQGADGQSAQTGGSSSGDAKSGSSNAKSGSSNGKSGSSNGAKRGNTDSYYDGATMVEVETGISNDTYIEILSGLTEGQVIVLPKTSTAASTSTSSGSSDRRQGDSFMGSGMQGGGGMPGGGMPGGF